MFAECALLTLALSTHVNFSEEYNEVHTSVGVTCKKSPVGEMSAGYYYNSEKGNSLWVAKRDWFNNYVFYEYGLVTGYKAFPVLPSVRVGIDLGNFEVFALPAVNSDKELAGVVGVQFKINF